MLSSHGLVGQSPAMRLLFDLIDRFAPHAHLVLIHGEPGSGRSTIAWLMHRLGAHRGGRYQEMQCSPAIGPGSISELFAIEAGQEGPGTGELGSIVLDEVADLAKPAQASLLGALVELDRPSGRRRPPPVAVIATTCRDLAAEVARDAFRPDLWYRLNAIEVRVPALRDRREDIPGLAAQFAEQGSRRLGRDEPRFTGGALAILASRQWPGNLRELRNVIERCCMLSDDRVIGERIILAALASPSTASAPGAQLRQDPQRSESDRLDDAQRAHVLAVLARERGNKARAAKHLGLSRRSLYRLLDRMRA